MAIKSFGKEITALARQIKKLRAQSLRAAGCTVGAAQFHAFMHIAHHEGCAEKQAAGAAGCDKTAITKAVKKLKAQGLVETRRDETDARYVRLWLTDAGRSEAERVKKALVRISDVLTRGMDAEQKQTLAALIEQMKQNVEADLEMAWHERET